MVLLTVDAGTVGAPHAKNVCSWVFDALVAISMCTEVSYSGYHWMLLFRNHLNIHYTVVFVSCAHYATQKENQHSLLALPS